MNFQDIYKRIYEIDSGKVVEKTKTISEECGMPPAMNSPYKPPVTMNVSMNATGPESIRDLIDLISGEAMKEKEMDAAIMKLGTQEDQTMENRVGEQGPGLFKQVADRVFGSEEQHKARAQLEKNLADAIRTQSGDQTLAGRVYAKCQGDDLECLYSFAVQKKFITPELDAQAKKLGLKGNANMSVEEYENEPDEAYQDTAYMTKDLAGGLNKQHAQYKKEYPGDNPMAVEGAYVQELKNLYQEIKNR